MVCGDQDTRHKLLNDDLEITFADIFFPLKVNYLESFSGADKSSHIYHRTKQEPQEASKKLIFGPKYCTTRVLSKWKSFDFFPL